jgi:HAE1 family hydrophobic/amphiphilic exporter-1
MVVHMLSPNNSFDQLYISNYALIRVRDELLRLEGVGDVVVFGAREYAVRVWLNPDRLAAFALTTTTSSRLCRSRISRSRAARLALRPLRRTADSSSRSRRRAGSRTCASSRT